MQLSNNSFCSFYNHYFPSYSFYSSTTRSTFSFYENVYYNFCDCIAFIVFSHFEYIATYYTLYANKRKSNIRRVSGCTWTAYI